MFDFFHDLFRNIPGSKGRHPEFGNDESLPFIKPNDPGWNSGFEGSDTKNYPSMFDFRMMTDPLEMHQYFEQKVNEMMKSFMPPEGFPGLGVFETPQMPAITEQQNPRDYYLKPGVGKPSYPSDKNEEEKSESITSSWLDIFVPNPGQDDILTQPRTFSSFRTVIRKTVQLPDGTMKTEEIIHNSDGSEERTEFYLGGDENSTPPIFSSPFVTPDFSGVFDPPSIHTIEDPRIELLKPGFEQFDPYAEKVDKDLDKQIALSGIESLPPFNKEPKVVEPNQNSIFKSFQKRIVTFPNGVTKTEEITLNPDGTEQRTVTHTLPDGNVKTETDPSGDSLLPGQNKNSVVEGREKIPFTLLGIKDLMNMFFK